MPAPKDPKKREEWIENLRISVRKYWEDPEERRKQSERFTGENNPMFGVDRSGEKNPNFGKKHPGMNAGENNPMFGVDRSGEKGPNYGKKHPGINAGENNPNFKGGVDKAGYHYTCTGKLIAEVRERDNYTCQGCGEIWIEGGRKFDTHHIYGDDDNDQPCDMKKLITLCLRCHRKVHKDMDYWIPKFEIMVNQEFVICGT